MSALPPRHRTGDDALDRQVAELVEAIAPVANADQIFEILAAGVRLGRDATDRLDLKITSATLREMRAAFKIFAPYQQVPKVTIFGSARTHMKDPLYEQTRRIAAAMAAEGWMVVTGAGPGIMQAGMEGAGREQSIGVSIRLPFEVSANEIIVGDSKLVSMKYFFTRKLMLMKESLGFLSLPGGFGTLDEVFELLTLQQTGKAEPAPIVLLDCPGDGYWKGWEGFVREHVMSRLLVEPDDLTRVCITDDVEVARAELVGFYRNYDSMRWVGKRLVLRLKAHPTAEDLAHLNAEFGHLLAGGAIERTEPLAVEVADDDRLGLPRIALELDQWKVGSLHQVIRACNALPSASAGGQLPTAVGDGTSTNHGP
ncbi:MAG: Rossman fold protein family [Acidimicrobiales bacterium]|nr:Rossman fold protein family [Acidimicrobiales bacterium]